MELIYTERKNISAVGPQDIPQLVTLVNKAYRENEKGAWTTEASLFEAGGLRTDAEEIMQEMQISRNHILKYEDGDGRIAGTVSLTEKPDTLYVGMLAVSPDHQGKGIGKALLMAARNFASEKGLPTMTISVIEDREELIDWYLRFGFHKTGEKEPFPYAEHLLSKPVKPLFFEILEYRL